MNNRLMDIVHIIPLGHEIDRAIRPFDTGTANRVYLLVDTGEGSSNGTSERDKNMDDIQKKIYTPAVTEKLREKNITVHVVPTKTFELESLLKTITSLIRLEKERGSMIQINMSSSGRLGAVGAFMAGMAYNVPTYYVHSDHFSKDEERETHGMSYCDKNHVSYLPQFKYSIPKTAEARILEYLYKSKKQDASLAFSPKEIIDYLESKDVEGFITTAKELEDIKEDQKKIRTVESRKLMRVAILLKKLTEDDEYLESHKEGRRTLFRITELGEHAYCLCGMDKEKYAEMYKLTV